VGIIIVQSGIIQGGSRWMPLLDALGIGLVAAGAVNIFDRAITLEAPPQRIEVVAEKRVAVPDQILNQKFKAAKVDIIGVSLNHFLEELINDPKQIIIRRLLEHNLQLRFFLVHPESLYLKQCARENQIEFSKLKKRQIHEVELCVKFYQQLHDAYAAAKKAKKLDTHMTGSLRIKLMDFCPYQTIYRIDEEDIYWGLYTSSSSGVDLPLFKTSITTDPILYKHLHQHIHGLLDRDSKYPDLVNMPEMNEPALNEELVIGILGKEYLR
jgi:hypothetical protein